MPLLQPVISTVDILFVQSGRGEPVQPIEGQDGGTTALAEIAAVLQKDEALVVGRYGETLVIGRHHEAFDPEKG